MFTRKYQLSLLYRTGSKAVVSLPVLVSNHRLSALLTFAPPDAFPKYRYLTGRPTHLAGLPLVSSTRGLFLATIQLYHTSPLLQPFWHQKPWGCCKVPRHCHCKEMSQVMSSLRDLLDSTFIGAAILTLNRSLFAEGLLTEAERARSGDLCPSQSKLEP